VDDYIRSASDPGREGYVAPRGRMDLEPSPHGGMEWGAASLVFGGVFAVMMPPALLLVESVGPGISRSDRAAEAAGCFFGLMILLLSGAGVTFGILSMNAAQGVRRPIALGLAGVMLNALNLLMWAGALLAWLSNW
jgi:hypothetical protein